MIDFSAIGAATLPLLTVLIPGISFVRQTNHKVGAVARLMLWSVSLWVLVSFVVSFLHLPSLSSVGIIGSIGVGIWAYYKVSWRSIGQYKTILILCLAAYLFFGIFFLTNHEGLPSGDSQKAIFWGQRGSAASSLPDYQLSPSLLNRDPVDFYTPGLHTFTGLLLVVTGGSLSSIGWLAITISVATAVIAMAMVEELVLPTKLRALSYLAGWLVLTNPRFLRYLREPGYHLQNVIGEFLLFGLLLLGLALLRRWRWLDVLLLLLGGLALLLSHQFSAFLAAFILLPVVVALTAKYASTMVRRLSWQKMSGVILTVIAVTAAGFTLGLHHKIPDLFTFTPHLRHLVLPATHYPRLLGFMWVYGGIAGLYILYRHTTTRLATLSFGGSLLMIFALSYGPWWGVDIPPVRALFYSIVPLGVSLASGVVLISQKKRVAIVAIVTIILGGLWSVGQIAVTTHQARTNSTLTPGQVTLVEELTGARDRGGVLVDDYNRRSSSWLLLAGRPMVTRLAADVRNQMAESRQSPLRHQLYLNQLDYEKIFSLGSLPEITSLLRKHSLGFVTGITGASRQAFAHNPALQTVTTADDITIYALAGQVASPLPPDIAAWLLRPSTLANDIGDDEDTYEHLPVSLRTTRLSGPQQQSGVTVRTTQAPYIELRFNVRDYTRVLWSKDGLATPDTALEFYWQLVDTAPLMLRTSSGGHVPLTSHAMIRLPQAAVAFDEDGFITLHIENPTEQRVTIDLVALGLARIP